MPLPPLTSYRHSTRNTSEVMAQAKATQERWCDQRHKKNLIREQMECLVPMGSYEAGIRTTRPLRFAKAV